MLRGISIFILAAAAVTAGSAFAQPATPDAQTTQPHAHHGGRFAALDHNGDGYLDKSEVSGKLAENFDKIDANHDGKLSRDELRAAWKAHRGGHHHGHHGHHGHHMGLAAFDTDHDGRVSLAEFNAAMKMHFDRLDTNHDGYIDGSEMAARHKGGHHGGWGKSKDAASASQGAAPTSK